MSGLMSEQQAAMRASAVELTGKIADVKTKGEADCAAVKKQVLCVCVCVFLCVYVYIHIYGYV